MAVSGNFSGDLRQEPHGGKMAVNSKKAAKVRPSKGKTSTAESGGRTAKESNGLQLSSLNISNFRGIRDVRLPRLGRVTLMVGRNSVGKSTVLEALQLYASGGAPSVVGRILSKRENIVERFAEHDRDFYSEVPDYGSLFFGYDELEVGDFLEIGPDEKKRRIRVELSHLDGRLLEGLPVAMLGGEKIRCLSIVSRGKAVRTIPVGEYGGDGRLNHDLNRWLSMNGALRDEATVKSLTIPFKTLGPGLPSNESIVPWYEELLLLSGQKDVLDVLRLIRSDIESVASRGYGRGRHPERRIIGKLEGRDIQLPLKSMGDGIVRLFGLAISLVNSRGGFLLIDEVENGIYHSLFRDLWRFVLRVAQENNVQVIATTHSWDCVAGFARAAAECDAEGRLYRIERDEESTWAVSYTEEQLAKAARMLIDVR